MGTLDPPAPARTPASRTPAARSAARPAKALPAGKPTASAKPTTPAVAASADPSTVPAFVPALARPLASYYLVLFSASLLLLLGLVMVLSASSVRSFEDFGSSYTVFMRQVTWVGMGLPVLVVASRLPVRFYRALSYPVMVLAIVLLFLVLIPPFGRDGGGAQRWIGVGSFTLGQPSEIAKIALALWGADLLVRKRRLLGEPKHLIVPLVPVSILLFTLIMLEPDMGTTIVVLAVLLILLWVVGTPVRLFLSMLVLVLAGGTVMAVVSPYRLERLTSFRDPFADAFGDGYQAVQGIYALSSGGWWGEGLGASKEKWPDLLPAAHTDFILAIIGEELGLPGSIGVVVLFGVLGYAGIRIAHRTDDPFVRLAAAASVGWITTQAVVNMAAVVGLLPITGIPLPLVSFGGSSLILTMFTIGMLLAFARGEPAAAALLADRAQQRRGRRLGLRRGGGRGDGRRDGRRDEPSDEPVRR